MMKIVHFNIDPMDLQRIEEMIRNSATITTIWPVNLFDRYSLGAYVKETSLEKNKFFALLDRNIYTDIIAVAKSSGTKPHAPQQKVACALLAFLQLAEVTIEPNMAINEHVDSGHHEEAVADLRLFRAVDNLDPRILMELALGRINKIPASMLNWEEDELVESKKGEDFLSWKIFYGFALKLAIIELQGGKPVEKHERFLDWVYKEYVVIGSAIIFALVYFSQRFKGMVKHIGSGDKDKVLRGVRNATWDMRIAYYWSNKVIAGRKNGISWLLCTADKALGTFAGNILVTHELAGELEQKTEALFCNYLGDKNGRKINDKLVDMKRKCSGDKSRRAYKLGHVSSLYPVVDELEKELLSKLTKHKCKREN